MTGSHDEQYEGLKVLARLAGASGERPPKAEQSATDCRWTWSTVKRGERRVWEVKTGDDEVVARGDVNQLLGQIEVETKRTAKTRVYGCLLTPATSQPTTARRQRVTRSPSSVTKPQSGYTTCSQIGSGSTRRLRQRQR